MDAPCQGIACDRGTTWTCTTQTTYRELGQKALPARRSFPPNYTRLRNDDLSLHGSMLKIWFLTWICCWSKLILCCCCRSCCCCLAIYGETENTVRPRVGRATFYPSKLDMMLMRRCKHHSSMSWTVSKSSPRSIKQDISYQWPLTSHLKCKQYPHHSESLKVFNYHSPQWHINRSLYWHCQSINNVFWWKEGLLDQHSE